MEFEVENGTHRAKLGVYDVRAETSFWIGVMGVILITVAKVMAKLPKHDLIAKVTRSLVIHAPICQLVIP